MVQLRERERHQIQVYSNSRIAGIELCRSGISLRDDADLRVPYILA
jgi:hypothetical protein